VDDAELLRLVYRFAGELVDVEAMLKRGAVQRSQDRGALDLGTAPPPAPPPSPGGRGTRGEGESSREA
jgi:hypothetical protein